MSDWQRVDIPQESDVEILTRRAMIERGCPDVPALTAFSLFATGRDGQELSIRVLNIVNLARLIKTLGPRSITVICANGENRREVESLICALVRDDMTESQLH